MRSVVYLTTRAPSEIAASFELAGYRVFEALEVSEVLHLCEYNSIDVIVIGPDVEDPDLIEARLRHITVKLSPEGSCLGVEPTLSRSKHLDPMKFLLPSKEASQVGNLLAKPR